MANFRNAHNNQLLIPTPLTPTICPLRHPLPNHQRMGPPRRRFYNKPNSQYRQIRFFCCPTQTLHFTKSSAVEHFFWCSSDERKGRWCGGSWVSDALKVQNIPCQPNARRRRTCWRRLESVCRSTRSIATPPRNLHRAPAPPIDPYYKPRHASMQERPSSRIPAPEYGSERQYLPGPAALACPASARAFFTPSNQAGLITPPAS